MKVGLFYPLSGTPALEICRKCPILSEPTTAPAAIMIAGKSEPAGIKLEYFSQVL
jgi:hypothetical protein